MDTANVIKTVASWISYIIVGGGGLSLIVYQIFKHLGAKWLDARFEERLQNLKHEQAQVIERMRFKISTLLDRATKLHQREFEVLPEAWAKANDAYWKASQVLAIMREVLDLDGMSGPQRENFIVKSRLMDWQKDEVRAADDKSKDYDEKIFWHDMSEAQSKAVESFRYLGVYGIFIEEKLRSKLRFPQCAHLGWFDGAAIQQTIWSPRSREGPGGTLRRRANRERTGS